MRSAWLTTLLSTGSRAFSAITSAVVARIANRTKEPPLWRVHSPIVSWWTASEVGPKAAYRIVYDGRALPTPKNAFMGSIAFRAVRAA